MNSKVPGVAEWPEHTESGDATPLHLPRNFGELLYGFVADES